MIYQLMPCYASLSQVISGVVMLSPVTTG